jgi:hypothetical protein
MSEDERGLSCMDTKAMTGFSIDQMRAIQYGDDVRADDVRPSIASMIVPVTVTLEAAERARVVRMIDAEIAKIEARLEKRAWLARSHINFLDTERARLAVIKAKLEPS